MPQIKVQWVLYNPLIRSRTPHKWRIRWWTGWLPSCALSACSSASEPPRRCSPLRCPRGRRPPPADGGGTEGWSRTCLQISQVAVLAILFLWATTETPPPPPWSSSSVCGKKCDWGTWVVPAASSGAAPHPATFVHWNRPLVNLIVLQGVGGEVTDLDLGVVLLEVLEWHPRRRKEEIGTFLDVASQFDSSERSIMKPSSQNSEPSSVPRSCK